jgi:hypothetical protein
MGRNEDGKKNQQSRKRTLKNQSEETRVSQLVLVSEEKEVQTICINKEQKRRSAEENKQTERTSVGTEQRDEFLPKTKRLCLHTLNQNEAL